MTLRTTLSPTFFLGACLALGACAAPIDEPSPGSSLDVTPDEGAPAGGVGDDTLEPASAEATTEACEGCEEVSPVDDLGGLEVLEGDILATPGTRSATIASAPTAVKLWPRGVVPYVIDAGLTNRGRVVEAIAHWRSFTGIRLVPRTTQTDYVRFVRGKGCSSFIGRVGGRQDLNLADACPLGSTIHEIGHAIGLYHEQSRSDRDAFVKVDLTNVDPARRFNYRATTFASIGSYDLKSIMHYGSYYFSSNKKPVMTSKDGKIIRPNRAALSPKDVSGVRQLYAGEALPAPLPEVGAATALVETSLRAEPTATAKAVATVAPAVSVQRLGTRSGNYLLVAHDGVRGWMYEPFLKF